MKYGATMEYLTAKQIATRLGVSRDSVYYWARCGRLPGAVRIGGTLRVHLDAFEQFLRVGGESEAQKGKTEQRTVPVGALE